MKAKKCFLIEYQCKHGSLGRQIVIAETAPEAIEKFFTAWDEEEEQGIAISKDDLETLKIEGLCKPSDMLK